MRIVLKEAASICRVFHKRYAELLYGVPRAFMTKRRYTNAFPIKKRYVATRTLMCVRVSTQKFYDTYIL